MRFHPTTKRWAALGLLALIGAVLLSACGQGPENYSNVLQPKGPISLQESNLTWIIFGIAAVIWFIVTTWLIVSVIRFRARPGLAPALQTPGNTKIEIAWTIIPAAILFVVLGITISTMFAIANPPTPATLNVVAIGHQWWWEFQYPVQSSNGITTQIVTADEMHIPVNTVVHVSLVSDNVIHSFWVPELSGKTDVIPGHDNSQWLKSDTIGSYRGACAEFCGSQHAHMDYVVKVDSASDFHAWAANQQTNALTPATAQQAAGQQVFLSAGCIGCHQINGVTHPAKLIGPNLTHFGGRSLIAGWVLSNTPANLAEWVAHAQDVKPDSDMPSFDGSSTGYPALSQTQVNDLVAYLESLQ
ncbi:MAG: cytochrome c oxidase subunit II [Ktedonobacterales bacterium]